MMKKPFNPNFWSWLTGIIIGVFVTIPATQFLYSKQNNPYATIEPKF